VRFSYSLSFTELFFGDDLKFFMASVVVSLT